jgi:hypothetical protein
VTHGKHEAVPAKVDAKNRALRTFLQNLGIDLLVAVALVIYTTVGQGTKIDWALLGLSILKTVLSTAASYIMRVLGKGPQTTS